VVISRRPRLRMVSEDGLCTKIEDGVCKRWCRIVPVRMKKYLLVNYCFSSTKIEDGV
jgi:hypothetical protein